jgi:hypothetical protein
VDYLSEVYTNREQTKNVRFRVRTQILMVTFVINQCFGLTFILSHHRNRD